MLNTCTFEQSNSFCLSPHFPFIPRFMSISNKTSFLNGMHYGFLTLAFLLLTLHHESPISGPHYFVLSNELVFFDLLINRFKKKNLIHNTSNHIA
ncbi:Protein CBG27786 [Caenorhabditis briggsae]|uniref:Protein CBG27786 n=1 Tax=Caenorhabditis briggsae TaxID=6238 RepID=B6II23_CAEBR|nr:Protein CBG27786 [Caenorhabditis briggsae]CAR99553.1 Protein CBG27786 [Caenorhabditis briggsae]